MIKFKELGHTVYYLSQCYGEEIQLLLAAKGIHVYNTPTPKKNKAWNVLVQVMFLSNFCRKHHIQLVFSHLEPANFISSIAQFIVRAKVVICRHHVDEFRMINKDHLLSYKLTYKLGRKFIVVSKKSKEYMIQEEGIADAKIDVINLSYDFNLYPKVNEKERDAIREEYACDLLMVTACRMVENKRPDVSIMLLKKLVDNGISAKLLLLGDGDLMDRLSKSIKEQGLQERCFMLGRVEGVLNYLSAADVLVHPSLIDSSSVIIKEAGLVNKPVIVCSGIGDVDDYIENGVNGILVRKDYFVDDAYEVLVPVDGFKAMGKRLGTALHESILKQFSVEENICHYDGFLAI